MAPPAPEKLSGRLDGVRTRHVWLDGTIHDIDERDHEGRLLSREVIELRFEDESVGYLDDPMLARHLVDYTLSMIWNRTGSIR